MTINNPFLTISQQLTELKSIVLGMQPPVTPEQKEPVEDILSIDEAAKFLGIAKQTAYIWSSKKLLPSMKVGKKLYFSRTDLMEFLKSHRRKTISEIQKDSKTFKQVKS